MVAEGEIVTWSRKTAEEEKRDESVHRNLEERSLEYVVGIIRG